MPKALLQEREIIGFIPAKSLLSFSLVTMLFLIWGIPNNMNDILIKQFMKSFELTRFQAGLIQSAFYMGYFFLAVPSGLIMKRYSYKVGLIIGLLLFAVGCFMFWPAALAGRYELFLFALFIIASGLTFLETGANIFNIGPKSDGTITDEETQVLLGTGKWINVNGGAIYSTRPWKIYGEGPTKSASGQFADQKEPFNWHDVRFTTKGDTLYVIALGLPDKALNIKALSLKGEGGKIATIKMLGTTKDVSWKQNDKELSIMPSGKYPSDYAVVYALTFNKH